MDDYIIGSGAVLTAGPRGSAVAAALHARANPRLARSVKAALVDFEGSASGQISRVVAIASGWNAARFRNQVIEPLAARGDCGLAEVLLELAGATDCREVHVFARWLPDEVLTGHLRGRGIELICHPLDAIEQAALISGATYLRWHSALRAA